MFGAEPMTVQHRGIQYAQPSSWKEPGGSLRFAASACGVLPAAAQTTALIATSRAVVMLFPLFDAHNYNRQDRCCATRKLHRSRNHLADNPLQHLQVAIYRAAHPTESRNIAASNYVISAYF